MNLKTTIDNNMKTKKIFFLIIMFLGFSFYTGLINASDYTTIFDAKKINTSLEYYFYDPTLYPILGTLDSDLANNSKLFLFQPNIDLSLISIPKNNPIQYQIAYISKFDYPLFELNLGLGFQHSLSAFAEDQNYYPCIFSGLFFNVNFQKYWDLYHFTFMDLFLNEKNKKLPILNHYCPVNI